jgi:hypothetical protein
VGNSHDVKPLDARQRRDLDEQLRRETWNRHAWQVRFALALLMSLLSAAVVAAVAAQFTHKWMQVAALEGGGALLILMPFVVAPPKAVEFWFRGMSVSDEDAAKPKRFGAS